VEVRQTAGPDPHRLAAAMRTGGKQVPGAIRRGFQRSLAPFEDAVRRQADARFPAGYAAVFGASVQVRVSVRTAGQAAHADVRVWADGQADRRKIAALEAGVLAHPVYGRYRTRRWTATRPRRRQPPRRIPNPWVRQRIRPGFGAAALDEVRPQVTQSMRMVLNQVEQTIRGA
jgi:hypothetical protein